MIYENMETSSMHINTVMHQDLIHFKNLTADTATVLVYKFKLVTTNKIKLISFFEEKLFSEMLDGKLQSFVVDWGDGSSTKVFTENINTEVYNTNSTLKLEHDYISIPTGQEITLTIMSEFESLCPISFDNDIDGIEIVSFGGVFDRISSDLNTRFRPHLRKHLVEIFSLHGETGKTLMHFFSGRSMLNLFSAMPNLSSIASDVFDTGCEQVTDITQLFLGNSSLINLPRFDGFRNVSTANFMCSDCSSLLRVENIFSHLPIVDLNSGFKNCVSLTYVDKDNFIGKTNLSVSDMFSGCSNYLLAFIANNFDQSTFSNSRYIGIAGLFSNIPNLTTEEILTNGIPTLMQPFESLVHYDRMFMNSASNIKFNINLLHNLSLNTADDMFALDTKPDNTLVDIPNNSIRLSGNNTSIVRMLKNRNTEIHRETFNFENVTNLDYTDSLVGNVSLYNDKQIFKEHYREGMSSGVTPLIATIKYTVEVPANDTNLKFSTVYNKFNPDLVPELDAYIKIIIANRTIIIDKSELESMKNGLGFKNININAGTHDIVVEYTHCAPMTLTYENKSDYTKYTIKNATIELFPTDSSYIGRYGLELWVAENIDGNLFRMFYDRPNIVPSTWNNAYEWTDRLFAYFGEKVKNVSNNMLVSIANIGIVTRLNELFSYEYNLLTGRDLFNTSEDYVKINPFLTFSGDIFAYLNGVTSVYKWFNEPVGNKLINITAGNIKRLFGNLTELVVVDKVLHACEIVSMGLDDRITWVDNNVVEDIISYIGRVNYLDKELLMKPKLKKINRFHLLPMVSGCDAQDLSDCYLDFAESVNDIDITEMFYNENFEIPDRFIRNVKGALTYNNCFKGSYRFDINVDFSLFDNVNSKKPGDVTGMEFITLAEPLSMEFNDYTTETGNIGLKLKDKEGSNHRVVARLYRKDSERYKVIKTKHIVISDNSSMESVSLIEGTLDVKLELWCTTANIYLENLSLMTVKNLSGVYGRTQWVNRVRMQDAYPGLVPSNIVCTDAGGPWKNVTPTNGTIDFTEMFTGITNKELIDYRILKTNSPAKTTYNMTGMFKNGSIADFDIRMFEFVGDILINGTSMFESNSDENFKFVNLNSGPYIFMEILFSKFTVATRMFKYAAVPRALFNYAPFFGCSRNGSELENDKNILTTLKNFISKYQDSTGNSNNVPEEFLPNWNLNMTYKLAFTDDMFIHTKYRLDPSISYNFIPITDRKLYAWAMYNISDMVFNFDKKLALNNSNDVGNAFTNATAQYDFKLDYHLFSTNLTNDNIRISGIFNSNKVTTDSLKFKLLIEPFDSTFESIDVRTTENNVDLPPFRCFQTYAPDNILFRNVKSFTGTSGAELLTYPNFIEYQNIHLTGNQISFIREELAEAHRFSTYLTVHIKYSDTYEEAKWFIVDKNADSYTIDLEASKIVNNTVSIKIQSTQCFYLMKTNVDYVEKLEGTYRKDLQPRDSEFFNFDVDYYYFIERFGADLWKDVKIKQGDSKFRFGISNENSNKLVSIDGSPFRTQNHVTNINYLFYKCKRFVPSNTILTGFGNVTTAYNLFNQALSITSIPNGVLDPLVSVTDLGHLFHHIKNISNIPVDLFHNKPNLLYINESFGYTSINSGVRLAKEFWNNISPSVIRYRNMFYECQGLSIVDGTRQFIASSSFTFNSNSITTGMFSGTNLLDVRISWIKEGSLVSANSIDMFKGCYTYEERSAFEARYGNQTGVNFKCYESCVYKSSSANLTGRFIPLYSEPTLDKNNEYVKVAVDSGVYFKTLAELENTGITVATSKVEVYSDYPIIFECTNVERLEGKFPTNNGSIFDLGNFNLGQKYPNLKYIDPLFFSKLTNASDMSYVFRDLRDINIIPANLFTPMVNLRTLNGTYSNAKGTINNLSDITNFIGPSTNINSMDSLFKNVSIKQIGRKAIKLRNSGTVNLTDAFNGTNAYVDADTFEGSPSSINITGMFRTCKSLYSIDELTNLSKTGDSLLEVLKSFKPLIGLSGSNSEINLMVLHDTPDASKIVDVLVDWGDGNSNIMVGVRTDSITHISKVIASSGDKTLRIWCSYYSVGVKNKTDSKCSSTKHLGGTIGKVLTTNTEAFVNLKFNNATSIDSTFILELLPSVNYITWLLRHSKIVELPPNFLKRSTQTNFIDRYWVFEDMLDLTTIHVDFFKEIDTNISERFSIHGMFFNTPKLSMSDLQFSKLFSNISRITDPNWISIFKNTMLIVNYDKIKILIDKYVGPSLVCTRIFSESFINEPKQIFDYILSKNVKISSMISSFQNSRINISSSYIFDRNVLTASVRLDECFTDAIINGVSINGTNSRMDVLIVDGYRSDMNINITKSLTRIRSVYTESEIFGGNNTTGSSGLTTDPRTTMKMTVSAGTLNLIVNTNADYTSKLLIKKNGKVESLNPYANKSLSVADNDIIEVITFNNIKDAYVTIDLATSTSKVKHLDGILNIGPKSIVDGKFNKTIAEAFGTDVISISDTFLTQFNTVTSASGLCKGLINLTSIPKLMINHMIRVTNWASMFENCNSLVLTQPENSEMFINANKGVCYDYMFKNCTSITVVPEKFFKGCLELDKTFIGTFTNTRLTRLPDDIDEF